MLSKLLFLLCIKIYGAFFQKFNENAELLLDFFTEKLDSLRPGELITAYFTEVVTKHVEERLQVS